MQIIYAYSMSKSTVVMDGDSIQRRSYNQMNFGEFVEIVCRLCIQIFEQTETVQWQLAEKLRFTLEDVFSYVDEKVKIPRIQVEYLNMSDSD